MPVLTSSQAKDYLIIEEIDARGQRDLDRILTASIAVIETYLGAPLTAGRSFDVGGNSTRRGWATVSSQRTSTGSDTASSTASITSKSLVDHPDWATRIEHVVNNAILDLVSEYWHRRNPGIASESEAGVSRAYTGESVVTPVGLPPRLVGTLRPIKVMINRWVRG